MPESEAFWEMYWEMRLQTLQNLGKREAILTISKLIRRLGADGRRLRLLELGCGEAQIIGALVEGHARTPGIGESVGVDYLHSSIETCRKDYPGMTFIEGDFTKPELLDSLGQFDIVLMVNALHEVFSTTFSEALGEVDVPVAYQRVEAAFAGAVGRLAPGGHLVLFDGLEPAGDPRKRVRVRFLNPETRQLFETFAREYRPFKITYRNSGPNEVELSLRDFTRYITKSIFLGKRLWQSERFESYQYYNETAFLEMFARNNLKIIEKRTLTVDEEKWRRTVEIRTPGVRFPEEHILIVAQK